MDDPPTKKQEPILEFSFPGESTNWITHPDIYDEVVPSLRCSSGWISDVSNDSGSSARVSFFKWDSTDTVNTLEAFKHLPEQCMGAIGMKLEKLHPARIIDTPHGALHFDSTQFRPEGGGPAVHIFKCVWVSGFKDSNLREDALQGQTGNNVRQLRIAAAISRFKPPHTRIIMGGISGMPTEALAWREFLKIVEDRLIWTHVPS